MSVRRKITEPDGVFFITFTCARWLPLFAITNGYAAVYNWFDYLKQNGHHIVRYVIMPGHVHALIAFSTIKTSINTIIGNGKRFMAYELVKLLQFQNRKDILQQLTDWINTTQKMLHKKHEVFEPSFFFLRTVYSSHEKTECSPQMSLDRGLCGSRIRRVNDLSGINRNK